MGSVLITGASRGIGLEFATQFLDRQYQVFASCRNPEGAAGLLGLQEQAGDNLVVLPLDVTRGDSITKAAATVGGFTSSLDILINNAGIAGGQEDIEAVTGEDMIYTYRTNAVGPFLVAQTFIPLLKSGNNPRIISITSRMGSIADNGGSGWYAYRASKAALNMVNANLAIDLKPGKIGAVVLHPGWVQTDMGSSGATLKVSESVAGLVDVIEGLTLADSGKFLDWSGMEIPW